jgi:lysophospholipase L1-like esterase/pimeloyl-ACP methyl ester carboxylesterase
MKSPRSRKTVFPISNGNHESTPLSSFIPIGRRTLSVAILLACLVVSSALAKLPPQALERLQNVHRILFLGDSITYAGMYVQDIEAYYAMRFPDQTFEFINVGLSSETVSGLTETGHAGGKYPRPDLHERLRRILAKTKPDLVFACYGMNDGIYQSFDEERFKKFREGMQWLHEQVAAIKAPLVHITPPVFDPVAAGDKVSTNGTSFSHPYAGYNQVLDRYSAWLVSQRASGWEVIDLHSAMNRWLAAERARDPNFKYTKDGVHPDAAGHWVMAKQVLQYLGAADAEKFDTTGAMAAAQAHGGEILKLVAEKQVILRDAWLTATGHKRPGVKPGLPLDEAEAKAAELDRKIHELAGVKAAASLETGPQGITDRVNPELPTGFPGTKSAWQGFDRYDFDVAGKPAVVVAPRRALPGRPWAWRGEFFGAYANVDAALLTNGFHIAYLGVTNLFGSPAAVGYWNDFYRELTVRHGLAKKVALIGLSRGGLYCYNWAIANPEKVACIYADAPVCDFKSWPGRHGHPPPAMNSLLAQWKMMLKAYGFHSDAEALAYRGNPVDNLEPLAQAGVPLLHVYGDADTTVPWEENTGVVAARYRELGGSITLIAKPGGDHHPHGLPDPAPIVHFILSQVGG